MSDGGYIYSLRHSTGWARALGAGNRIQVRPEDAEGLLREIDALRAELAAEREWRARLEDVARSYRTDHALYRDPVGAICKCYICGKARAALSDVRAAGLIGGAGDE